MPKLTFFVDGQPLGKQRPRFARSSGFVRVYTPGKTASYEAHIKELVRQVMQQGTWPIAGPVKVSLCFFMKVPKSWSKLKRAKAIDGEIMAACKPDIDNLCKAVLDACNKILWVDDAQIVELSASKLYGETPGVLVEVDY